MTGQPTTIDAVVPTASSTAKAIAEAAALDAVGEGTVTGIKGDDEETSYVEVTVVDGSTLDVRLDEIVCVVGAEDDGATISKVTTPGGRG